MKQRGNRHRSPLGSLPPIPSARSHPAPANPRRRHTFSHSARANGRRAVVPPGHPQTGPSPLRKGSKPSTLVGPSAAAGCLEWPCPPGRAASPGRRSAVPGVGTAEVYGGFGSFERAVAALVQSCRTLTFNKHPKSLPKSASSPFSVLAFLQLFIRETVA
jgi:hypothetical protein